MYMDSGYVCKFIADHRHLTLNTTSYNNFNKNNLIVQHRQTQPV